MKTTYNKLIGLLTAATIGLTLCSCGGGGGGGGGSSSKGSNGGSSETRAMAPELSPGDQIRITVTSTVVDGFTTTDKLTIISDSRLDTGHGITAPYSYKRNGSSATFSYTTVGIHQSFGGAASTIYKTIRTIYDLTFTSSTTAKINSLTYETAIGGTVTERKTATSGNATFTIL